MLIRFLNAGLINVGGDDTKLEKLKETSKDLSNALKKNPYKTTSFSLIAFDPESPEDDPVILEVVEALQKRWPTYVNTFSGTPVSVIRAILLDALIQSSASDEKVGVAFSTSARNTLPFIEADNERAIWIEAVAEIESRVNERAEIEWAPPESISLPAIAFPAPDMVEIKASDVEIDKKTLEAKIAAACGPTNAAGQPTGGNQYLPNSPQPWVNEFSTRMATAIYDELEIVLKGSVFPPVDLSKPLEDIANVVSTHIDKTLDVVSNATIGLQRRTNLIWWKEALYSPSAKCSYRKMSISTAAASMAFDLFQQVPIFSPASVGAFLEEVVLALSANDSKEKWKLIDLVNAASEAKELVLLREVASQLVPVSIGRGPVLNILGHGIVLPTKDDGQFRTKVGISPNVLLDAPQWALWLFRELQSAQAVHNGGELKKRGRKS